MAYDISPLWLSLKISILATIIVFILGIGAARLVMKIKGSLKWILDVLFTLPLVLPPTVVGFILLLVCGKNSWLGMILAKLHISIIFTSTGAIIATTVVVFPIMYRAARGAFEQIDQEIIWAARTLGLSELRIFIKILLPEAWPGILGGLILAFTRALGEFGATLMVAGNIPKVTQTIPLAIYFATVNGKMAVAAIWTLVITLISCIMLWAMNRYSEGANKL